MAWRVKEAKVLLVRAIRRQDERGLAREVLEEQLAMGCPGLGQEVSAICKEVGLPDACRTEVEASRVKENIRLDHLNFLNAKLARKEKLK